MAENNKKTEEKEKKKEIKYVYFIEFEEEIISPYMIRRIKKESEINGEDEIHRIIVNCMDADEPMNPYKNLTFEYDEEDKRDKALDELKRKMQATGNILFI